MTSVCMKWAECPTSCISQWIIHISPRRICNPACVWFLARYEWSLSFSINALSSLLLSSWRAEPNPTEPLKEQLQEHRNADCHAPLMDDGQMWTNCPMWAYFLPAWQQATAVSWDSRGRAHMHSHKQHKPQIRYKVSSMWCRTIELTSPLYMFAAAQLLHPQCEWLSDKPLPKIVIVQSWFSNRNKGQHACSSWILHMLRQCVRAFGIRYSCEGGASHLRLHMGRSGTNLSFLWLSVPSDHGHRNYLCVYIQTTTDCICNCM